MVTRIIKWVLLAILFASPASAATPLITCNTSNHALQSNGATQQFLCATVGGSPAGSDTDVQFNQGGVFGGSANYTFDYLNNQLNILGVLNVGVFEPNFATGLNVEPPQSTNPLFDLRFQGASYSIMSVYSPTGNFGFGGCAETAEYDIPDVNHFFQVTSCGNMIILSTDPMYIESPGNNAYLGDGLGDGNSTYFNVSDNNQNFIWSANGNTIASLDTGGNFLATSFTNDSSNFWKFGAANTKVASITVGGTAHSLLTTGTTSPSSVTSCGTGTPTVTGTDVRGTVTTGSAATACTVNFGTAFATAPFCTVSDNSLVSFPSVTSTNTGSLVIGLSAALTGGKVTYVCIQ
jgi:hypothetical protein